MAKEIFTRVWCDLHLNVHDERVEADRSEVIRVDSLGGRPLSLDVCETCHKELIAPLVEALEEYGAPADAAADLRPVGSPPLKRSSAMDGPFRCEVHGCIVPRNNGLIATRQSLAAHLRRSHGLTITQYRDAYGEPRPVAVEPGLFTPSVERGPIGEPEATCPECGKVYSHETGSNRPAQALGVHRAKAHGISGAARSKLAERA